MDAQGVCASAFQSDSTQKWDPGGGHLSVYNDRLYSITSMDGMATDSSDDEMETDSRTELDSHANMPVVGRHAYILAESGKTVSVHPFTPDYEPMQVPLVDAAVWYDSPYDGKQYILVLRNALHVPSMTNNLIPPFAL